MLVHRPSKKLLTFKGYDIIVKSHNPTESVEKFDAVCMEFGLLIKSLLEI